MKKTTIYIFLCVLMVLPAKTQAEESTQVVPGQPQQRQGKQSGDGPAPTDQDGPAFRVDHFIVEYAHDHPDHPPIEPLMTRQVRLGLTPKGYVAARPGVPTTSLSLEQVGERDLKVFYASAIRVISESLVAGLHDQGLIGIYIEPDTRDIDRKNRDHRPEGMFSLRLLIRTAFVTETRTIASGERVSQKTRIGDKRHQRIVRLSPLQRPGPGHTGDLLRKDVLDDFLFRLNRHPGRRVDASIAAGPQEELGGVSLDYLVSENKPWLGYAQISNTGTDQTDEYRVRMGFVHHQLTDNDDILRIDYITAGFDEAHAVTGSYESPVGDSDRARWRGYGAWSDFTASEVALADLGLSGESWLAGIEFIYNVYQCGPFFVDLVGGARFERISVDNRTADVKGRDDFFLPYGGARLDYRTDHTTLFGSLTLEANTPSLAGTEASQINRFGRAAVEREFFLLKWNFFGSVYLEPILGGTSWPSAEVPFHAVLAHELAFSFRGQTAFDDRLIPQFQLTAGGLYSVRGYPEALTSGDNVVLAGIEYRFHVPRALPVQPDPNQTPFFGQPFRFSPQRRFGQTDWDLVLKAFLDMAHTHDNDSGRSGGIEEDETLMGAGVGFELWIKRNFSFRADWGVALRDASDVTRGSSQFHFVTMILY